jgi:hypothetical protein
MPTDEDFGGLSEFNIVHLSQPKSEPDERSKYVRYARSASRLAAWRKEEILVADHSPAFYVLRKGDVEVVIGLAALGSGEVVALREVKPREREDHLRLLEATRAHFEVPLAVATSDIAPLSKGIPLGELDGWSLEACAGPSEVPPLVVVEGETVLASALAHLEGGGARYQGRAEGWLPVGVVLKGAKARFAPHRWGGDAVPAGAVACSIEDALGCRIEGRSTGLIGPDGCFLLPEPWYEMVLSGALSGTLDPLEGSPEPPGWYDSAVLGNDARTNLTPIGEESSWVAILPPAQNEDLRRAMANAGRLKFRLEGMPTRETGWVQWFMGDALL